MTGAGARLAATSGTGAGAGRGMGAGTGSGCAIAGKAFSIRFTGLRCTTFTGRAYFLPLVEWTTAGRGFSA